MVMLVLKFIFRIALLVSCFCYAHVMAELQGSDTKLNLVKQERKTTELSVSKLLAKVAQCNEYLESVAQDVKEGEYIAQEESFDYQLCYKYLLKLTDEESKVSKYKWLNGVVDTNIKLQSTLEQLGKQVYGLASSDFSDDVTASLGYSENGNTNSVSAGSLVVSDDSWLRFSGCAETNPRMTYSDGRSMIECTTITNGELGAGVSLDAESVTGVQIKDDAIINAIFVDDFTVDTDMLKDGFLHFSESTTRLPGLTNTELGREAILMFSSSPTTLPLSREMLTPGFVTDSLIGDEVKFTASQIAPGTIESKDLADGAVGFGNFGRESIRGQHIALGAIELSQFHFTAQAEIMRYQENVIGSSNLSDGVITSRIISDGAVSSSSQILDSSIESRHLTDEVMTALEASFTALSTGSVNSMNLAVGAVDSRVIADGSITSAKIATGAVQSGNIADNVISSLNVISEIGSRLLATGSIESRHFTSEFVSRVYADDLVVGDQSFVENSIKGDNIALQTIHAGLLTGAAVDSMVIADATIVSEDIADNTLALSSLSADFLLLESDLATGSVVSMLIADDTVQSQDFVNFSLNTEDFAQNQIRSTHIVGESISSSKVTSLVTTVDGVVTNSALLPDRSVSGVHLATAAVASSNIAANSITARSIGLNVLLAEHLDVALYDAFTSGGGQSTGVVQSNIGAGQIDSTHFQEDSITSSAIANGEVKQQDFALSLQASATGLQSASATHEAVVAEVNAVVNTGMLQIGASARELTTEERASVQNAISAYSAYNLSAVATAIEGLTDSSSDLRNYLGSRLTAGAMAVDLVGLDADVATNASFASSTARGQANYLYSQMQSLETDLFQMENNIGVLNSSFNKVKQGIALSQNLDSLYVERGRRGSFDLSFSSSSGINSYGMVFATRFSKSWIFNVAVATDEGFNEAMYSIRTNFQW